jgi:hypothetical protein
MTPRASRPPDAWAPWCPHGFVFIARELFQHRCNLPAVALDRAGDALLMGGLDQADASSAAIFASAAATATRSADFPRLRRRRRRDDRRTDALHRSR